ncbi:Gfo/Idh/MocA family protein [Picosynechococcus sp. PCC 7117]|uniref:Gfo/Idh/MocA family protein n=1 Tax=Picosynechococcus sp. PCC 7117 TaxID=195498 RepID=UPI000810E2E7|nr:Gfo/Idh/MocA family oxidoreductase [Picosynechococcus sp. PCC 7117]ANV86377.1 oxidoreductase [Picosynechococcus sp. PCC 7117]
MSRVIVVGAGHWGKNLVQNFYELGALAGVVELAPVLREKVIQQYPDVQVYADFAKALNSEAQGIVIATPAPTHYSLALAALEAGKDVFVEKPMTLRADEAKALAEYADQQGRILMVGHLLLYQGAIAWMRDYLATGKAGQVLHVATRRTKLGRVRREENVWWSFAPHDVSVVLDLLGQPTLQQVKAAGRTMLQPTVADDVDVALTFAGGQTAHIHCSWYAPLLERKTMVIGSQEMLVYDEVSGQVTVYQKTVDQDLQNQDQGSWLANFESPPPLRQECQHFLDCMETRQRPRSDGWNGVAVVNILEQVQRDLER